jgi:hypothetical protein
MKTKSSKRVRRPAAQTTYYSAFPAEPRSGSILCAVFWVVENDYRAIATNEKRNVIYPAKRAGLIESAPCNILGVKVNLKGETSKCGFVLTEDGRKYYEGYIKPVIPEGFVSAFPAVPTRHIGSNLPIETIASA